MVHDEAVAGLLAVGLGQTGKGARLDRHAVEDHAVTVENKTFQGHADSLFAPPGTTPYRKDTGTGPRPAAKADEPCGPEPGDGTHRLPVRKNTGDAGTPGIPARGYDRSGHPLRSR